MKTRRPLTDRLWTLLAVLLLAVGQGPSAALAAPDPVWGAAPVAAITAPAVPAGKVEAWLPSTDHRYTLTLSAQRVNGLHPVGDESASVLGPVGQTGLRRYGRLSPCFVNLTAAGRRDRCGAGIRDP